MGQGGEVEMAPVVFVGAELRFRSRAAPEGADTAEWSGLQWCRRRSSPAADTLTSHRRRTSRAARSRRAPAPTPRRPTRPPCSRPGPDDLRAELAAADAVALSTMSDVIIGRSAPAPPCAAARCAANCAAPPRALKIAPSNCAAAAARAAAALRRCASAPRHRAAAAAAQSTRWATGSTSFRELDRRADVAGGHRGGGGGGGRGAGLGGGGRQLIQWTYVANLAYPCLTAPSSSAAGSSGARSRR